MRILVNGASGRMGRALRLMIEEKSAKYSLAGAADKFSGEEGVISSLDEFEGSADCVIDFSNHACTGELLDYCVSNGLPVVVATTGQTDEEIKLIEAAAQKIPVFYSGNMSLGIALLTDLVRRTAAMFPDADIEIVEQHHNQKLDVPSGTALMLGRAVCEARPDAKLLVGRHENGKRTVQEVGIHSLRTGSTVGMHEVIVHTGTQVITLKHEAIDRSLFAEGALAAGEFLTRCAPGLYRMEDMIKEA